ncbi:MAG: carboxypeptidase regulatory-like domain-containing protein [Pseudomonadota bacterium]
MSRWQKHRGLRRVVLAAGGVLAVLAAVAVFIYLDSQDDSPAGYGVDANVAAAAPVAAAPVAADSNIAEQGLEVHGRVVDSSGGGVAGISIDFGPEAGETMGNVESTTSASAPAALSAPAPAAVTTTGPDGVFLLRNVDQGTYRVRASGAAILAAGLRRIQVPGPSVEIVIVRRVATTGIVRDRFLPVAGALVTVTNVDLGWSCHVASGPDGRFAVYGLPEGRFLVTARAGATRVAVETPRLFGPGPWEETVLSLDDAGSIAGSVVAPTGEGLGGAEIVLSMQDGTGFARKTRADEHGVFLLEGIPSGEAFLNISASGYLPLGRETVIRAGTVTRENVSLSRGAVVDGRVVSTAGTPIASAVVQLVAGEGAVAPDDHRRGSPPSPRAGAARFDVASLDVGSRYRFAGRLLPVGELGVMPGPIPYPPPPGTVAAMPLPTGIECACAGSWQDSARRASCDTSSPFVAGEGEDRTSETSAPGKPSPLRLPARSSFSDGDGRFRLSGIPSGSFRIRALHDDWLIGASASFNVAGETAGISEVLVVLQKGATVVGQVSAASGSPIRGAVVVAATVDGRSVAMATTDQDGRYRLDGLAGDVILTASSSGFGSVRHRLSSDHGVDHGVDRGVEGAAVLQDFVLHPADRSIVGQILDWNRQPLASAQVEAIPVGSGVRAVETRAVADGSGVFRLAGLTAGRYRLEIDHPEIPSHSHSVGEAGEQREQSIEIVVPPAGGLAGVALDRRTGDPIPAFLVDGVGPRGTSVGRSFVNGDWQLIPLEPGHWTLTFKASSYASSTVAVVVPVSRERGAASLAGLRVGLDRGALLAGVVYDRHGEPVAQATVRCGTVQGLTDGNGRFLLQDVPPGDTVLEAWHSSQGHGETVVPLRSGDELRTLEVRLESEP